MDLQAIIDGLRGEGGVIFGLLLAVIVFFRGGVVTGKAYETMVNAYENRLEAKNKEIEFWRDQTLHAIKLGEKVVNDGSS